MRREKDIYHSRILNKTRKIIEDSKRFNKQVDFFINRIETQRSLPPLRVNRGEIRKINNEFEMESIRARCIFRLHCRILSSLFFNQVRALRAFLMS